MTSYTASDESVPHPPGSFPTDDMTPSTQDSSLASSQSHHNKLHKCEDPRGWSDEEKAIRGHQYTDSGVGLADSTYAPVSQSREKANDGAFHSNTTTLLNRDATPINTRATTAKPANYYGNESKPTVMAGAFSRVDNNKNDYPKPVTQDAAKSHPYATGVGAAGLSTGTATAATSDSTERERSIEDRNIIRNGLRQTSNIDHQDPYWGDVPYGTGVYNTVTGHGSSEKPADGSVHTHGPELSHEQQRAFPRSTSNNAVPTEAGRRDESRFKEDLAATGAGLGAGLTASELAQKRRDDQREKEFKEPKTHKHDETATKKESKIGGLFHRDHKDDQATKHEKKHENKHATKEEKKLEEKTPSKDDSPLTKRDAGAALAAASMTSSAKDNADKRDKHSKRSESGSTENKVNPLYHHSNEKVEIPSKETTTQPHGSKDPFIAAGYTPPNTQHATKAANDTHPTSGDVTTRGHPFTSQTTEKPTERNDSNIGYGLAAAGAGAGAGYAAHEYAHRSDDKYKESITQPTNTKPTASTPKATVHSADSTYTIGQPQLGVVAGSTGTSAPSKKQSLPQTTSDVERSPADSSRYGEYNVLADGTPSGINIGDNYGDQKNIATSSPNTAHNAMTKDNHTGAKVAAAGAGVAGTGAVAHYASRREGDKISPTETHQGVAPTSKEVREPHTDAGGAKSRDPTGSSRDGTYNVLSTGTPSGVNVDDGQRQDKTNLVSSSRTNTTREPTKENNHSGAKAAAAATGVAGAGAAAKRHHDKADTSDVKPVPSSATHTRQAPIAGASTVPNSTQHATQHPTQRSTPSTATGNRTTTDPSHGGEYNVLPSGTPSGINIGEHEHEPTSNIKTPSKAVHSAAAGTSSAPKKTTDTTPATAAGMAAAAAAPLKKGDRVLHRCRKCGEENDITGYFRR